MKNENRKVAYFSMEFAIDQSFKIYSGGLGFLAGSHLKSAFDLGQDMIGVGLLYSNGYYDQERGPEGLVQVAFKRKEYHFLKDLGLVFQIHIHGTLVNVKAFLLSPEVFGTAPLYLLTTDIPQNDFLSRSISFRLYDNDLSAKVAQSILLGAGGARLLELLKIEPDVYHLNEGHGLPLIFSLYNKFKSVEEVRKRLVFTTHTPVKAGNDIVPLKLLDEMNFFGSLPLAEVKDITKTEGDLLNYTLTALRFSKIANGVSKIHQGVATQMWGNEEGICPIVSITNAQNANYWTDHYLKKHLSTNQIDLLIERKKELKQELLNEVANQTGKLFDKNVLTIVWARRVTAYKRIDLLFRDVEKILHLLNREDKPLQIIFAGKNYPEDIGGAQSLNELIKTIKPMKRVAFITGYELKLSALLKKGADLWLNTPRYGNEASGTSGMTASMNGTINFSIADGWFPEFARHGENSFVIPHSFSDIQTVQDDEDNVSLMKILEKEIISIYYSDKTKWSDIITAAMNDVIPQFDSNRMVLEYKEKLYNS